MFTWPRISSISSTSYPAHSSCVSMSGHPSSTAPRTARARSSSAPSSNARSLTAGRSACQHGSSAFSPASARKKTGTRGTRNLRVISSYASIVGRSACVSSTSTMRSPAFPFTVRLAMRSPASAFRGVATVGRDFSPATRTTRDERLFPGALRSCSHPRLIPSRASATLPRHMVTLQDVLAARERIRRDVDVTPCPRSWTFSDLCGASVYFKLESLQRTGSFKERGAANKLSLMSSEERKRGVVAASAGNHAQGVAYNAHRLGVKAVIVMPETTPLIKVAATRQHGAEVVLCGTVFEDAYQEARRLESEKGYVFIHAFDDDAVIAGQGTAALEILEQVPDLDVLVASIGGGGFLGGMATAVKALRPQVRVVGVEAAALAKMTAARREGKPVVLPPATTLADGIAVKKAGERTLPLFERYVDDIVSVDDEEVANAVLVLIEREKVIAEGAGAAPAAALLQKKIGGLTPASKVVCVISGG